MFGKLVSAFLSVMFLLQTLFPAFLGGKTEKMPEDLHSVSDYVAFIEEYGAPAMSTETFFNALKPVKLFRTLLSGSLFAPEEEKYLPVSMSEDLSQVCQAVLDETGFDMLGSLQHLPRTLGVMTALKRSVHPDLTAFRHKLIDLSDTYRQDGHTTLATLIYLFGVFFSVVDDMRIYTVPGETPEQMVVMMDVTYADGTVETVDPDIIIDTEKQVAYARQGYGVAGSGFEVDLENVTLYTVVNSWQRKFGFCLPYDLHADQSPVFIYETRRFPFTYGGKDWRIQIWKGNYALVTNGGELGVYTRPSDRLGTYYDAASDEDMLTMSMEVFHGDERIVSRGPERHWWVTGFKLMKNVYTPASLTMRFSVELRDADMLAAFTAAIDREFFHDVSYTVDGLTVYGEW